MIQREINRRYSTDKLRVDYPHVGLYDVHQHHLWIARKRLGVSPIRVSHARLLKKGGDDCSTADKDRFMCFWFHTPGSGSGHVHGYPIEWSEGHLLVRLDPNWDYATQRMIPSTETAKVERNVKQQYKCAQRLFDAYLELKPDFPLCWHMIGPRATESMFYIQRVDCPRV